MLIRDLTQCEEFMARDKTALRELLHPDRHDVALHYSLAHAVVEPGKRSAQHVLQSTEVYYILQGQGIMYIDDESEAVRAGQAIYIPAQATQWIENTGAEELQFLCIVDPAWQEQDEEILQE